MLEDFAQMQSILARISGVHGNILGYLGGGQPLSGSMLAQPTEKAAQMARNTVQNAGRQRGLSERSLGTTDAMLSAQVPELLSPLGQFARQYSGSIDSLVDPRMAQFLRPDTISSSKTTPSDLQTATQILSTAGQVAGAVL